MNQISHIAADGPRPPEIDPWTLSFRDRAFEERFQKSWLNATAMINRSWVVGGIGFYALSTILLIVFLPSDAQDLIWIRYAVALPIMLLSQVPLFWHRRLKAWLGVGYLTGTLAAFGTTLTLFTYAPLDHHFIYLIELATVFTFAQHYTRIRFLHSAAFSIVAIGAVLAVVAFKPEVLPLPFVPFVVTLFFFGLVGVLASYTREVFVRRNYASIQTLRTQSERNRVLAKEAVAASEAKSRFLAIVTHELRTPLNAIIGYSESINAGIYGKIDAPKAVEAIDDIHDSGTNLLAIVNELLELTSAEIGSIELHESDIDVPVLLDEVQRAFEGRRAQHEVDITLVCDESMAPLHADQRLVRRMLTNLIGNAIKYTPKGGEVWIYAIHLETGELIIEIKDTGIGIAPDQLEKAMAPFGQVDDGLNRRYEGVGIGLPLVRNFIELHGGSMHIESAEDKGTSVQLRFPAERMRPRNDDHRAAGMPPAPQAAFG